MNLSKVKPFVLDHSSNQMNFDKINNNFPFPKKEKNNNFPWKQYFKNRIGDRPSQSTGPLGH